LGRRINHRISLDPVSLLKATFGGNPKPLGKFEVASIHP
jgi:hypothetical protein